MVGNLFLWLSRIGFFLFASQAMAKETAHITGHYRVEAIKKTDTDARQIIFRAQDSTTRDKVLVIESDHVHIGLRVGLILKISAEILERRKEIIELSQVLLYLDGGSQRVFQISRNVPFSGLKSARFLEMHSPMNDFLIF